MDDANENNDFLSAVNETNRKTRSLNDIFDGRHAFRRTVNDIGKRELLVVVVDAVVVNDDVSVPVAAGHDNGLSRFPLPERFLDLLQRLALGLRTKEVKEEQAKYGHNAVHGERARLAKQLLEHRVRLQHDEYAEMADTR